MSACVVKWQRCNTYRAVRRNSSLRGRLLGLIAYYLMAVTHLYVVHRHRFMTDTSTGRVYTCQHAEITKN